MKASQETNPINDTVDTVLVNFRVNRSLIDSLDLLCRFNRSTRTAVLISLIRAHLANEIPKIEHEIKAWNRLDKTLVDKKIDPRRDDPPGFFSTREFERDLSDDDWEGF